MTSYPDSLQVTFRDGQTLHYPDPHAPNPKRLKLTIYPHLVVFHDEYDSTHYWPFDLIATIIENPVSAVPHEFLTGLSHD